MITPLVYMRKGSRMAVLLMVLLLLLPFVFAGQQQDLYDDALLIFRPATNETIDSSQYGYLANEVEPAEIDYVTSVKKLGDASTWYSGLGTDTRLQVASNANFSSAINKSVCMWTNHTTGGDNGGLLFAHGDALDTEGEMRVFYVDSVPDMRLQYRDSTTSVNANCIGVNDYFSNTHFEFFCGTVNITGTDVSIKVYRNTTFLCGATGTVTPAGLAEDVQIGWQTGVGKYTGGMDELVFFNRSLSDSDISFLWNDGAGFELAPEAGISFSSFTFEALNGSQEVIGGASSFTAANMEAIEFMRVNFTATSPNGFSSEFAMWYAANGTNSCATGNNGSTCISYPSFVEFRNNTVTSTFDALNAARGDLFNCTYSLSATEGNYSCLIDEHYNPNVYKNYPLNFSDQSWADGANERINGNTLWKFDILTSVPPNADYYKIDFRVNTSTNPTIPLDAYACNSLYNDSLGSPVSSPFCVLVASHTPSTLQDDGTKFRGVFTSNVTGVLTNLSSIVLRTDQGASLYYAMRTLKHSNQPLISTISNNNGVTYSILGTGYESDFNINWFFNNDTAIIFKAEINDTTGNTNSSENVMNWNLGIYNLPPLIDIDNIPNNHNINGVEIINVSIVDPNGHNFTWNATAFNGTTHILAAGLSSSISNFSWSTLNFSDGNYNLSVIAAENDTTELYTTTRTITVTVDNTDPIITITAPSNGSSVDKAFNNISVNAACADDNVDTFNVSLINSTGVWSSLQSSSAVGDTITINNQIDLTSIGVGAYNLNYTCVDTHTKHIIRDYDYDINLLSKSLTFTTDTKEEFTITLIAMDSPITVSSIDVTKEEDRYTWTLGDSVKQQTYTFRLDSSVPLRYHPTSSWLAHFTTKNHWIDFETDDTKATASVFRINDDSYTVQLTTSSLSFSSIGGLNKVVVWQNVTVTESTSVDVNLSIPANQTVNVGGDMTLYFVTGFDSTCDLWLNSTLNISDMAITAGANSSRSLTYGSNITQSWYVTCQATGSSINGTSATWQYTINITGGAAGDRQTFSIGDCPDTTPEALIISVVFIMIIALIIIGAAFKMYWIAVMSSIIMIVAPLYIIKCIAFIGAALSAVGAVFTVVFALLFFTQD